MDENLILYDWLSFTVLEFGLNDIKELLGLAGANWEVKNGVRGYAHRQVYENIVLHYGGEAHEEIWCEMSGQGCRAYETYGANCWDFLLSWCAEFAHITRLDVAYDDHTGVLDIDKMYLDACEFNYVSRARSFDFRFTDKGKTIYIGSPSSSVWFCIYDKARERRCTAGTHWIRVEAHLMDKRAAEFILLDEPIGEKYAGVILHYLRFVEPNQPDSNKWRWPIKEYWANFLRGANEISLWTSPGVEYNLSRCEDFVYRQSGNAIHTLLLIYGPELFMEKLQEQRPKTLQDKYKALIKQYERTDI